MEAKDYVLGIRKHGLTQAQIATETRIPQPTVSKIERGDVSDVMSRNYRALQALHQRLEVSANAFQILQSPTDKTSTKEA